MGPRSEERGNMSDDPRVLVTLNASMGPRSEERGNLRPGAYGRVGRVASMGPRSEERGNWRVDRTSKHCELLQWGRALRSAEMTVVGLTALGTGAASMGPRSEERGNGHAWIHDTRDGCRFNGAAL